MLNNDNTEKTKLLTDYKYTQGEIDWIRETQKSNAGNTFYFIKYNYLHAKMASSNESDNAHAFLLDVLNAWDYTEKNTFFYLFSDHGDFSKITYKLEPIACVTFAGIKNNNSNFNYNHDKINIKDFYNIIMGNKIDTDIFYGEDGRAEVNSDKSTSCYVAKSICDIIHIVTYHKNIFYGYRYNLAEDTFCECFPDSELKEKLINKIKWISI